MYLARWVETLRAGLHVRRLVTMDRGFYVMGQTTSVAWFMRREDAEKCARALNWRGGTHYRVQAVGT